MSGASSNIQTQINLKAPLADPTFTGTVNATNLTLSGDLTINGTTTTLNSTTLTIDDKNIELGSVSSPTDITADGGGITLKGTTDKTLNWVDSTDSWTSSENVDLAAGKNFTVASNPVMCPTGMVSPFAGSTAPNGWLLCFGQAVSRSTYAGLFAVIGTTYGAGDGSTTFALPDLRGRAVAGLDNMGGSAASRLTNTVLTASNTLGATGGAQTHTLTSGESGVPAHQHSNTITNNAVTTGNDSPDHTHSFSPVSTPISSGWSISSGGAGYNTSGTTTTGGRSAFHQHSVTSNVTISNVNNTAANASSAHLNTQPTIVLNYIVKI